MELLECIRYLFDSVDSELVETNSMTDGGVNNTTGMIKKPELIMGSIQRVSENGSTDLN